MRSQQQVTWPTYLGALLHFAHVLGIELAKKIKFLRQQLRVLLDNSLPTAK
jgi:hypothetical protein